MKTGRPLPDLASELCRVANAKRDFLIPAHELRVSSNGHTSLYGEDLIGSVYRLNDIAHAGLADYTNIPHAFYQRLRESAETLRVPAPAPEGDTSDRSEPLFDTVVNTILKTKAGDTRLIRTLDGTARAFLSDSYSVDLDNYDVFQVAARAIEQQGLGPDNVVSAEVTERKLYLKIVSPKLEAVVRPDNLERPHGGHHFLKEPQVIQAGFILTNSEVGLGSLAIQQVAYKLMCTNLWVVETAYKTRHVGKVLETDGNGGVYRSDTRLADAKARLLKLRDHISEALDEHRFMQLVARMQETAGVTLEGSIEKVVEGVAKRLGIQQSEKERVVRHLIEGADLSAWGLSNAITATAQEVESYDRATELESLGGRFFTMPASELKELVSVT